MKLRQALQSTARALTLLLFAGCNFNSVAAAAPTALEGDTLVEALRSGGYNIYFRHAATEWSQSDHLRQREDWLSCDPAAMRQIAQGRAAVANGDVAAKDEIETLRSQLRTKTP